MEDTNLFIFGIFASAMLIAGFVFTMLEFKKMGENAGDYTGPDDKENKK